jgi:hypothetical protein
VNGGPNIARQILVIPLLADRTREPDPEIALNISSPTKTVPPLGDAAAGPARVEDATSLAPAYIDP